MILSFESTMPNVGSWNGQWTGQSSKYYRHRNVSKQEAEKILADKERNSWYYNFGDGWGANVSVEDDYLAYEIAHARRGQFYYLLCNIETLEISVLATTPDGSGCEVLMPDILIQWFSLGYLVL